MKLKMISKLGLCGLLLLGVLSACQSADPEQTHLLSPLNASGFIEVEEIAIAPEIGGRVMDIVADVGDEVIAGTLVVSLDDRIAQAQVDLAQAKVQEAAARLEFARSAVTNEAMRVAQAQLAQAQAGRVGACQAVSDTLAILENPQALDRQIAVTRAQLRAAEAGHDAATMFKDIAGIGVDQFYDAQKALADVPDRVDVYSGPISDAPIDLPQEILDFLNDNPPPDGTYRFGDTEIVVSGGNVTVYYYPNVSLPLNAHFAPNQYWQAWIGVSSAESAYSGLRYVLALLYKMRDNPTQILEQVDVAITQCEQAKAQQALAYAQVVGLEQGASAEALAALQAQHQQALAELQQAQVALEKQHLIAPANGIVLERPLESGELASPSGPVLILADLDEVYLTLYLPNQDLGRVRLDQTVRVRVDSFPERTFTGYVANIGNEAEFPPQRVPQPEDRATLIFSVRVYLENPDHLLKPGILAEATFEE